MLRCFVIQPFDKGPFDARYEDVLAPAIKDAELEPYRVDLDPAVSIPIESIEDGIQSSYVCLADISLDNPNVWFEVGYAIAAGKEVVFICSAERKEKFPFDVQHRNITEYSTGSRRNLDGLQKKITERLKATVKANQELGVVSKLSPTQKTEGLAPHEVAALVILMEHHLSPDSSMLPDKVRERMRRAGFADIAVGIALASLHSKDYIEYRKESDGSYNEYTTCALTDEGLEWIRDNHASLVLRADPPAPTQSQQIEISDEDIPF